MADMATTKPTSNKIRSAEPPTPTLAERASETGASVLVGDDGTTIVHNEVVAKLAGMAVREVDGVHELVPFDTGQSVSQLASRMVGRMMRDLGIQVEVGKTQAAVDVRIICDYGVSLVDVARNVRKNVQNRIEKLTGLKVVEVNIEVVDLYFEHESAPEQVADLRRARVQ